jgi:hypothetical protein
MLPGVFVAPGLVGSSDFRTELGAEVPLALEIYCRHRAQVSSQEGRQAGVRRSAGAGSADGLILTGVAVPFEGTCRLGGWVLEVADIPVFVTEATAGRASSQASTTAIPTRIRKSHFRTEARGCECEVTSASPTSTWLMRWSGRRNGVCDDSGGCSASYGWCLPAIKAAGRAHIRNR